MDVAARREDRRSDRLTELLEAPELIEREEYSVSPNENSEPGDKVLSMARRARSRYVLEDGLNPGVVVVVLLWLLEDGMCIDTLPLRDILTSAWSCILCQGYKNNLDRQKRVKNGFEEGV